MVVIIKISFLMANKEKKPKIKNLKISEEVHHVLKEYCKKNGLKMFAFVEQLIKINCKSKRDIYGE
tara:strand:- start:265 stop:462 length:198 start_codon:yes stop_codon:yes gene_type:complete